MVVEVVIIDGIDGPRRWCDVRVTIVIAATAIVIAATVIVIAIPLLLLPRHRYRYCHRRYCYCHRHCYCHRRHYCPPLPLLSSPLPLLSSPPPLQSLLPPPMQSIKLLFHISTIHNYIIPPCHPVSPRVHTVTRIINPTPIYICIINMSVSILHISGPRLHAAGVRMESVTRSIGIWFKMCDAVALTITLPTPCAKASVHHKIANTVKDRAILTVFISQYTAFRLLVHLP